MPAPMSGTFEADFSPFIDECAKADQGLESIQAQAAKTEAAVDDIGGTLGDSELPENVERTDEAMGELGDSSKNLLGYAKELAGAFGLAFTVQGVVNFGKHILDTADNLTRLSDQTGIGVEDLQRLDYIAGQSGNTLDDLTAASSKFQATIGDEKVVKAVERLGLTFDELNRAKPYEQMHMLATAIAQIENPTQRAQAAYEVFGKSAAKIMPTLIADWNALASEATVTSKQTVAAVDRMGDALARLGHATTNAFTGAAGAIVLAGEQVWNNPKSLLKGVEAWVKGGTFEAFLKQMAGMKIAALDAADAITQAGRGGAPSRASLLGVTDAARDKADAEAKREKAAADREAKSAAEAHAAALQKLRDQMFGDGVIKAAQDYVTALGPMSNLHKLSTEETNKLHDALELAIEAYTRVGTVAPQAMRDIYAATLPIPTITAGLGAEWNNVGETVKVNVDGIISELKRVQAAGEELERKNQEFYKSLDAEIQAAYKSAETNSARMGETVEEHWRRIGTSTDQATSKTKQYAIALQEVTSAQHEAAAAQLEFDAAQNRQRGGGGAFWSTSEIAAQQEAAARAEREQAGIARQREAFTAGRVAGAGTWGNTVSISVDARSTGGDRAAGQDIAVGIVNGMRREGIKLGH